MEQQQVIPTTGPHTQTISAEVMGGGNRQDRAPFNGPPVQDDDPPRKRRLLFPKARPKKMQEFLCRQLNTDPEFARASDAEAFKPKQTTQPPPASSADVEAVVCGGRSFEEIMAAAGVLSGAPPPRDSLSGNVDIQQPVSRRQKLKCTEADKGCLEPRSIPASSSCPSSDNIADSRIFTDKGNADDATRETSAATPPLSASNSLLDSSCLGVQRLTLQSPSANDLNNGNMVGVTLSGKSPPEKRPSSGACGFAELDTSLAVEELGDGGLGPLQKAEDFSGIPLAARLQSKVVKQRVHGCDEVVARLASCSTGDERVQMWDELVKPHLSGILKDTNVLVGSKAIEMLLALVKGGKLAEAAPFPAGAALQLLQSGGKLIISQHLSNPRLFSSCCELMLTLSQASADCAKETVALLNSANQRLLDERKGNVAAIKGQGLRVLGSSMELLLQMLHAFGLQLAIEVGGVKGLVQPVSSFASCSDKRVRMALSSLAATSVHLTTLAAGEAAAMSAKKAVLECFKNSKSMQTEFEQLLDKFVTDPPPAPSRRIAGTGSQGGSVGQAQAAGDTRGRQDNVASLLLEETDVLKAVCQQQTDWVLRVTEGRQSVATGDHEGGEEPPWKVKLQAWQQLESGLRDCSCLYKKNPFLQQQLLPLMHRVLTVEPTLPVVTCVLKTLQLLTQLLLQPRGFEGYQQLQQQLRTLVPDVLAKLKMNNRPVQAAACACLGTYLCCLPIDMVVGDLLPIKEKLANYQKLLLEELVKAVGQQRNTPALHKAAPLLFAAAEAAAEEGNAGVRAAGVSLLAALATHAEGSVAVGDAMQSLPEQKRQQLQKAMASSSTESTLKTPPLSSSLRRPALTSAPQGQRMPFSRMRNRGTASTAAAPTPASIADRQGACQTPGLSKTFRKQSSGIGGVSSAKSSVQRSASSAASAASSVASASVPSLTGGLWEVPSVNVAAEEAEERTRALLPSELLQGLDATAGAERKRAYNALEAWCRRPCQCRLCSSGSQEEQMETEESAATCKLETFRKSAVHVLLHLRARLRGFKERTALLEEACMSCLHSIIGGLLLPADDFKAAMAAARNPSVIGANTPSVIACKQARRLPLVDKSIVGVVLEPLGDRLGDPRVENDVLAIGLLLARCVETPTTVASQLALLAEGRAGGGRLVQGVCFMLEQLLQQWGLQAFNPPKQLLMIVRQLLEPTKGARSAAFPLLKRLHAEMGSKTVTTMLVSHPLPDDIKHALKRQQPQQAQQQQQHVPEGSGPQWSLAAAALTAGAAAASAAIAGVACRESPRPSGNSAVSAAQNITPELLQRLQHSQHEETILKALQELMSIFVNKAGDKLKPDGLSNLVVLLRKRLGDNNAAVRRQVLLVLTGFCDRLGADSSAEANGASSAHTARVYKQVLPAIAERLCDSDKKVLQAAHLATAKWFNALGVVESLPLLHSLLSSAGTGNNHTPSNSHRAIVGAAVRRPLAVGSSGSISHHKNVKLRDALFSLLAVSMRIEPSREPALLQMLVPHLLDAVQPQIRFDTVAALSPACSLLSLLLHEGCQREGIVEMLRQRQAGQGQEPAAYQSADSALASLLVCEATLKGLLRTREDVKPLQVNLLLHTSQQSEAQTETLRQQGQGHCKETLRASPASAPDSPTDIRHTGANMPSLSTRSQRIQKSSGAAFLTSRRHHFGVREELYNELKGRLEPSLLLLMFPPAGHTPPAAGTRQGAPHLSQLKAAHDAWKEALGVDSSITGSRQQNGLRYPLQGEQSITDLMLKWIAFCISETQQQQRSVQAQECLCVLLQMTQLLLQPYSSMRVSLPLYEQQQILQQLLDVASANASIASVTSTSTPRPVAKQLRQQVREALLLLAATAEDRTKFLSTIHRSLIRCKNKELLVDLMAAMTRALGQHVQMQLQTEAGVVNGSETLSDFLSQQCAARFFSFLVDAKASAEQRNLALNFLVFCNLVLKGGALHLLPSLSPDYRARLVEATKQIAATGLSQSRLDSLILRHAGPGGSANEESSQSPAGGVNRSNDGPSETAVVLEAKGNDLVKRPGSGTEETNISTRNLRSIFQDLSDSQANLETRAEKDADVACPTSALTNAVAQADALLQTGGEELQQQASALEGWFAATKELRMQNKISEASFASLVASSMQEDVGLGRRLWHEYSRASGDRMVGHSVEQLCCLTALKTWCAELQLRSLPRAAFGAHCLLFLLTSASANPNSAAAAAASAAIVSAAQPFVDGGPTSKFDECSRQQHSEHQLTRRSGRQLIQLSPMGESVLNAHPLCSHFMLEGITKALDFFFEAQHYGTLHSACLSLQGAASTLLLADVVTRRRMHQYKVSGGSDTLKQKGAILLKIQEASADLKDECLQPLPDKGLLQRCCSCLLLCMGRYQDYLYKSPVAASYPPQTA